MLEADWGRPGGCRILAIEWAASERGPEGFRTLAFDPTTLSVLQADGQWTLRERRRVLLSFGNNEAEARRALAVFEHHHFDRVSYIGEPTPSFMYFLSSNGGFAKEVRGSGQLHLAGFAEANSCDNSCRKGWSQPADPKRSEIDPRVGSQLLPPGRQLLQVTNIPGQALIPIGSPSTGSARNCVKLATRGNWSPRM